MTTMINYAWALCLALATVASGADEPEFDYFDGLTMDPSIPTPADVIGHEIGQDFTQHHLVVDYCSTLADGSSRVAMRRYGASVEGRPLLILVITSAANHARLDDILAANLELTTPQTTSTARAGSIVESNPAIAWLSYNVHGNEASCTETALQVAYTLAASTNDEVEAILDEVVVVIDPCLNPDGRERYVSFYRQTVGINADPTPVAIEHSEPWPGGRQNHYLFDLNRDWTWCTQVESAQRLAIYTQFKPQLHIDNHEQGMHSPYFFGAGDTPYNQNIPEETKQWLDIYGRANAEVFDRHGLPYATRERFDYLYPGYGKVTPVYHGAVGLLTEQGGHGRGGLAVTLDDEHGGGAVLTLRRRAMNHFLTSMSYLETTAARRADQLERFARFYRDSMTVEAGEPTAYVLTTADPTTRARVWALCNRHGIEIDRLDQAAVTGNLGAYVAPFERDTVTLDAGSWVIRAGQPMGRLARALFERETEIEDRNTYDITSWTVPALYGIDAYEYRGAMDDLSLSRIETFEAPGSHLDDHTPGEVATVVPSGQAGFVRAIAAAARHRLFARLTGDAMLFADGTRAPATSLLIHSSRNDAETLERFIAEVDALGLQIVRPDAGIPIEGPALGNNANRRFIAPKIALLTGPPTSVLSAGHTWHMLDVVLPAPYTRIDVDDLDSIRWSDFNVLVVPSASDLHEAIDIDTVERLTTWVHEGGTVVAIGSSARWASRAFLELSVPSNGADAGSDLTWAEREAQQDDRRIPGALLTATVDTTHPLAGGHRTTVAFHVFDRRALPVDDAGHVVARFAAKDARIGGVISEANLAGLSGSPAVTHHEVEGGTVVCFASDPTNRGMNLAGMELLMRCTLLSPSMSDALQPLGAHEHD